MGKKNKKEKKKGKGAEKTLQKTDKKLDKKTKKQLAETGEEDIESLIAKFKRDDKKKVEVVETKCPPPSPRCNMSLTAHPDRDELILFGGEYFNGNKTFLYNDLFFYNCKKNDWLQVTSPNTPPPRCAHQAVGLKQRGGELWIFGGEFASPSQAQFYHYKDLWCFHLKEKRWEQIKASGGPSARSGHRMVAVKKQLFVFGGFHDNIRNYRYFNDLYMFDLETFNWSKVDTVGSPPAPRSACQMLVMADQNHIIVANGYSKEPIKRDIDKGIVHTDMFMLSPQTKCKEGEPVTKWKWTNMKQCGLKPEPRTGMSVVPIGGDKAFFFGGVHDEEEEDEDVKGVFYNSMFTLELSNAKWHETSLRGKKDGAEKRTRRRKRRTSGDEGDESGSEVEEDSSDSVDETGEHIKKLKLSPEEETSSQVAMETDGTETTFDDGVFTVKIGPQSSSAGNSNDPVAKQPVEELFIPHPRMNPLMAVQHGVLYLYGGVYEEGDKQVTFSDMYSIDVRKMDEWTTLIKDESEKLVWEGSDISSDEEEGATGVDEEMEDDEGDDDDDDDDDEEEPPEVEEDESFPDYFDRTKDFWLEMAAKELKEEGKEATANAMKKLAMKIADSFYKE